LPSTQFLNYPQLPSSRDPSIDRQMAKLGVRKTERYLPVGSVVTVVGELDESLMARCAG